MKTPRYVVDLDGVCCDFNSAFKAKLDELQGQPSSACVFDVWDWDRKYYPDHFRRAWKFVRDEHPMWWFHLKALPGVAKLKFLANQEDLEVVFLTNRNFPHAEKISISWLEHQGFRTPIVVSVKNKAKVVSAIMCDAVIDDSPENITNLLREIGAGPKSPKIYMPKAPYNGEFHNSQYIYVVPDLEGFLTSEGF